MPNTGRILIRGGTIIDGTGAAPRRADLVIEGETIADIAIVGAAEAATAIDATGCVVCPGFIDPHNHADTEVLGGIAVHPLADNLVRQGITTLICNQCGGGTYPIAPLLDKVDQLRPATNVAMLASHGRARNAAMQQTGQETPGPAMWTAMRRLLTAEMENGALGVTAGPLMRSQEELPTEELVEAGRAVAPFDGVYASHIRDEGETGRHLDAIEEVFTVARESGCRGHVSHIKLWGKPNWGQTAPVLDIFDRAARQGVVLRADQYPYIGGYRGFYSIMWTCQGAKVHDAAWRRLAKAEIIRQLGLLGGPERFILSS
ncbi:MAG TPA: amidohydrolase family protein, partial [Candidatus Brocadiia bacterium]|nr:amidohydrolase family protein [Candidatus Brocadiia bacterium]